MKITNLIFEYDAEKLKSYRITFEIPAGDEGYVNGLIVLEASDLDTQAIVDTVQNKLKALVQS